MPGIVRAIRDDPLTSIVALAAIVVATVVVYREFKPSQPIGGRIIQQTPTFIADWKRAESAGLVLGDKDATVTILAFSDLECPFCKRFHEAFRRLQAAREVDVSLVFVHFPLPSHRFAAIAAQAVECANRQGRVDSFLDLAFAKQDSFGIKRWESFASEAGVSDTSAFAKCVKSRSPEHRIAKGLAIGREMKVTGTPTVLINGWRMNGPSADSLPHLVKAVVQNKPPFVAQRVP